MHSSFLYATTVCPGATARCFSLKLTMISPFLFFLISASWGSCLYLIFADIFVGSEYCFLIRCRHVVMISFPNNASSSFCPTITIFSLTSVLMTYALKGSLSHCLCPIVKKYAHSCLPTIFPSLSTIFPSFLGNLFSRKSLMGILPMKHSHWLSLRAAFGSPIFFANALISGFVYHQIGNSDFDNWN